MTRMTRKEAKQIIAAWLESSKGEKGQCGYIEGWFYEKDVEAFHMAIEALKIQDESKTKNIIYDFLTAKLGENIMNNPFEFEDWFNRMVWHVQECYKLNKKLLINTSGYDLKSRQDEESEVVEQESCEDCISREWVFNKIHAYAEADTTSTEKSIGADCCAEFVENAPSVMPSREEPKRGMWIVYPLIDEGRVELECPICGDTFIRAVDYKPHFCENCGADMRGDEE